MINKTKASCVVFYVSLLAFILFAVYVLYLNQEVLYTAHDRSEFVYGKPYFHTFMSKPFGLIQYIGAWFTQLFYYPALGSGVLATIWIIIFFVGAKAFRLEESASALILLPVACLLTSVVDLGYWIYVTTIRGYWFSQSVGYLVMLLLLWVARSTPRKWHSAWYLLGFCVYPVLGWFALLFILCLVLADKPSWRELIGIVLLIFTAALWRTLLYSNLRFDDVVLAGLPRFITPIDSSEHLTVPFWVLGAVSLLMAMMNGFKRFNGANGVHILKFIVPVLCAVAGIVFTWSFMFRDRNYIDEMRMVHYAEDDKWKEVLQIVEGNQKPTTSMVFLKNMALMNEGGLLDRSFKMGNIGYPITDSETLHVTFLNIASPLVYYNYGMMNEAVRLSFENSVQYGFSPFILKVLSRCALAKGDKELLERYTTLLHHLPFYGDWQPIPVPSKVKELQNAYSDEITGVENSDSYIINSISSWNKTDSKVSSEQALFYSMISCDAHRFWPTLRKYMKMHEGELFPLHAQEAYIIFIDREPEEKPMMLPVEEGVYHRYQQFCDMLARHVKPGKILRNVAEEMRKEWGDTYWYYYYFGRKYVNPSDRQKSEVQS